MKTLAGALMVCCGAVILAWAFATPGDQIAVSCIGGVLIGFGVPEALS